MIDDDTNAPALTKCTELNTGDGTDGYDDWRLPSLIELKSLVYCSGDSGPAAPVAIDSFCSNDGAGFQKPTINQSIFPNTGPNSDEVFYWTANLADSGDKAHFVKFNTGGNDTGAWTGTSKRVRCVRGDPLSECGNGYREPGEDCDDGNSDNEDSCPNTCDLEPGEYTTTILHSWSGTTPMNCGMAQNPTMYTFYTCESPVELHMITGDFLFLYSFEFQPGEVAELTVSNGATFDFNSFDLDQVEDNSGMFECEDSSGNEWEFYGGMWSRQVVDPETEVTSWIHQAEAPDGCETPDPASVTVTSDTGESETYTQSDEDIIDFNWTGVKWVRFESYEAKIHTRSYSVTYTRCDDATDCVSEDVPNTGGCIGSDGNYSDDYCTEDGVSWVCTTGFCTNP